MKKIFLIAFVIGLLGCEKDDSNTIESKHKPYKLISYYSDIPDTSYITYDGINPTIIESQNSFTVYVYSSNTLIKQEVYRNGDNIPWMYVKYEYNNKDQVNNVSFNININSTAEEWIGEPVDEYRLSAYYAYEYKDNQVYKEYYIANSDTSLYNIFEYDINGNISKKTEYVKITVDFQKTREIIYSYDTKNHYLKDVSVPLYGSYSTKKNNVITEEEAYYGGTEITENTYEYDIFNFPTLFISNEDTVWKIEYIDE